MRFYEQNRRWRERTRAKNSRQRVDISCVVTRKVGRRAPVTRLPGIEREDARVLEQVADEDQMGLLGACDIRAVQKPLCHLNQRARRAFGSVRGWKPTRGISKEGFSCLLDKDLACPRLRCRRAAAEDRQDIEGISAAASKDGKACVGIQSSRNSFCQRH